MKKYQKYLQYIARCLLFLIAITAFSSMAHVYSPSDLVTLTEKWVTGQIQFDESSDIEIQVLPLDERLGNRNCEQPLSFSLPQGITQRQSTVQVSCPDDASWQLYIPVRITEFITVVTMKQHIAPGTLLTADVLQTERKDKRFIRNTPVSTPELITGARVKRALTSNQIISLRDLCLVCRGDVVTIAVDNSGLRVATTGIAQNDGTLGDTITVTNQQSGRTVQTEVIAVGRVKVKF